jgi:hypothetical protein
MDERRAIKTLLLPLGPLRPLDAVGDTDYSRKAAHRLRVLRQRVALHCGVTRELACRRSCLTTRKAHVWGFQ